MLKSKVIDIFRTLSADEMKQFKEFLRSPYHNKNKNVISLFEIIRKYGPLYNNKNLTKEKIFKKIFPGKAYNDIVMRILLSDLLKIAEDFLVQMQLKKSIYDYKKFLSVQFMDRKLDKLFLKIYNEAINLNGQVKDESFFKYKYDIEELNKGLNIDRNMQHLNSNNLIEMGRYLIVYFLVKLSSVVHDIDVNKMNFNTEFEESSVNGFLAFINHESIQQLIEDKNFKESEILELYYCCFMLISNNESDSYYLRLKELFYRNFSCFDRGTVYNIYLALLNYNGKKHWNDKENKYRRENLKLYKDMLERGIYSWAENEYMTIITFRSVLSMCSMLKDHEWMEFFINNYIDKLAPEYRENMRYFSHAKLNFSKKNYSASLENITKVNYNLFTFKFDVKTLMLQIYYELGFFEEAISMLDSYKHFLSNNKNVSNSFREWNVNFINLYTELLNHKSKFKKGNLGILKRKIYESSNIASQNWLKDKIDELEKLATLPGVLFQE